MNPLYLIASYLLGALSFGAFMLWLLVKLHPKVTPPTLHRRANRDRLPEVGDVPPVPSAEVGGIDYQWINLTGEER